MYTLYNQHFYQSHGGVVDWYNKSWVRGKMQRGTQVIQRLAAMNIKWAKVVANHPQQHDLAPGRLEVQTMEDFTEKIVKPF